MNAAAAESTMIDTGTPARIVRAALLVIAAWLAFSALQLSIDAALARPGTIAWTRDFLVDLTMALYWSVVTIPIAIWHRRLRARGRNLPEVLVLHLPLLFVVMLGDTASTRLSLRFLAGAPPAAPFLATITYFADFDVLCYLAVVIVVEAMRARDAALAGDRRAARLEGLLARARLEYLEAQLQPHFLFNALGAVSELAYEAPATALRVLRQLAHIFRNALSARAGEVTLGEELAAIEPYLEIQRLRFPDWLRIDYDVAGDTLDCLVPRFVLQPLVENAIRHGLTGRVAAGVIEISSHIAGGRLVVRVADNGVGLRQLVTRSGYGIGLTNVRERLTTLYGAGDQLRLYDATGGGAVAEVTLPARRTVDAAPVAVVAAQEESIDSPNGSPGKVVSAPPRSVVGIAIGIGVWVICGALWTAQSYAYLSIRNRLGHYTLFSLAQRDLAAALVWACFSPLIFAATARLPLTGAQLRYRLPLYLIGVGALAVFHAALLTPVLNPQIGLWSPANANTFVLNILIVMVLVGIGHRRQLIEWLRQRELAAATLSAELRTARQRAARLQAIPPVVLSALDRVIEAVSAAPSPRRTEQLLARLGDYLRVAIECSDEQGVTGAREQSLARSLGHLERLAGSAAITPTSYLPSS